MEHNGLRINHNKCQILAIRVDKRTKASAYKTVRNIPIVDSAKYPGIKMDDSLSFKPQKN